MYDGPVIDCDVHYLPRSAADWIPYLPREWREYVESPGGGRMVPIGGAFITPTEQQDGVFRLDSFPPEGPPGSDYETMRKQYFDRFDIRAALLTQAAGPNVPNGELVAAMCQAWNDWLADEWLSGKGRSPVRHDVRPNARPAKGGRRGAARRREPKVRRRPPVLRRGPAVRALRV